MTIQKILREIRATVMDWISAIVAAILLDDIADVNAPSPGTGYGLGWNGNEWVPYDYPTTTQVKQLILQLAGGTWFLHEEDSDISGYELLLGTPANSVETSDSAVANSGTGEVPIDEYITPFGGLGLSLIPGGAWHFTTFASVDSSVGTSQIVIRVYKRNPGNVETELFSVVTSEINATTVTEYSVETVQPDFAIFETDRIVIKYLFKTTSAVDRTGTLYYEGTSHYSHVHTPIGGGVAAISTQDTATIDMELNSSNVLTANLTAGLDDLTDVLVESYTDGATLVANSGESAFECRKLKFSELSSDLGYPIARTQTFNFAGTALDTSEKCNAVGIRFSGDSPFPTPNLGTISGSWSHVADHGWKPASTVDAQGPALLIPLPACGPNIKIVVEFEYAPSAVTQKGALHIAGLTRTQNVAAYVITYDDQFGSSGLTAEGQTNDGDETYTARYSGTFYAGSAIRTYGLRWLSACPGFYDAQDSAWHYYTAKPSVIPYTPEYLYIYFQKYSGFTFFDPVYIKSVTVSGEV